MTSQSGGGGGIPGVLSDNQIPGGEIIAGALEAGDPNPLSLPTFHIMHGQLWVRDNLGSQADGDSTLLVDQRTPLAQNQFAQAMLVFRSGALNGSEYFAATLEVNDNTASTASVFTVTKQGTAVLDLTTRKSIVGALSLVTDANAKAVLTSIIAALTGIKVATNNTT